MQFPVPRLQQQTPLPALQHESIPHVKAVFAGIGKSPENTAFATRAAITGVAMVLVIALLVVLIVAISVVHELSGLEPDGPEDSSGLDSLDGSIVLAARLVSLPAITPANRRASQPPTYICGIGADGAAHLISTR